MPDPLISIVMPVREMRRYTHQAITSILGQSHHQLELILVGQPDQTTPPELPADERIHWIARKKTGIVGALNTGLAYAHGDYIARMDDDDLADPERLRIQLDHLLTHQLDIVGARVRFFSDDNPVGEGNQRYEHWLNKLTTPDDINASIFIESPIPHPTFFASKNIWQQLGGYHENAWPEDYDLLLRAWQLGLSMGKPDQVLLDWREHPNRLTYTDERYSRQAFVNAKAATLCANGERFGLNQRPLWIAGTGRNARHWFDALHDNGVIAQGFVDMDRPNIKQIKRHRPVISYESFSAEKSNRFLVIALGNSNARAQCIEWCKNLAMIEMKDFIAG